MPIIAAFYGMSVKMYHADHNPPHFHVQYGEMSAVVELRNGKLLAGRLPVRMRRMLNEWRKLHVAELQRAWNDTQAMRIPRRIQPLE